MSGTKSLLATAVMILALTTPALAQYGRAVSAAARTGVGRLRPRPRMARRVMVMAAPARLGARESSRMVG
jgi:hypothetical protein